MPVIITVGYARYLLKDDVNVNTLIKSFEGAKKMDYNHVDGRHVYYPDEDRNCGISIEMVDKKQILKSKADLYPKRLAIPEKASPDCHGDNITKR